jgi:hypothetical protein
MSKNEKKEKFRMVSLSDGTGMGDMCYIFKTNAPVERLKELEKVSCDAYLHGNGYEDVPLWFEVLEKEGYVFNCIDECQHVGPYMSSTTWLETKYKKVKEHYVIENQPY